MIFFHESINHSSILQSYHDPIRLEGVHPRGLHVLQYSTHPKFTRKADRALLSLCLSSNHFNVPTQTLP